MLFVSGSSIESFLPPVFPVCSDKDEAGCDAICRAKLAGGIQNCPDGEGIITPAERGNLNPPILLLHHSFHHHYIIIIYNNNN